VGTTPIESGGRYRSSDFFLSGHLTTDDLNRILWLDGKIGSLHKGSMMATVWEIGTYVRYEGWRSLGHFSCKRTAVRFLEGK